MAIEFTCPNGHKLSSPDDHAGRMAKCRRCGAIARVPAAQEIAAPQAGAAAPIAASGGSDKLGRDKAWSDKPLGEKAIADAAGGSGKLSAHAAEAASAADKTHGEKQPHAPPREEAPLAATNGAKPAGESSVPTAPNPAPPQPAAEEQIVFLCPNGHKLNAPPSLQGRAGQCPHCGAKFRIPLLDESAPETDEATEEAAEGDDFGPYEEVNGAAAEGFELGPADMSDFTEEAPPPAIVEHPLAQLVTRLWSEREHGGIVELHLTGGAMLVPEWFEKRLSQQSHGLFATQAADGTVTMMIVPWDSVLRVVVRGVVGLPDGMFE